MQERRGKEYVGIDAQAVTLRQLQGNAVVALRVLPSPCRMMELRAGEIVYRYLPRGIERNAGGGLLGLRGREQHDGDEALSKHIIIPFS